jgi:hypothetical protein
VTILGAVCRLLFTRTPKRKALAAYDDWYSRFIERFGRG